MLNYILGLLTIPVLLIVHDAIINCRDFIKKTPQSLDCFLVLHSMLLDHKAFYIGNKIFINNHGEVLKFDRYPTKEEIKILRKKT